MIICRCSHIHDKNYEGEALSHQWNIYSHSLSPTPPLPLPPVVYLLYFLYEQFPKPETCNAAHDPLSSCLWHPISDWILLTSPPNNLLNVLSFLHHHLQYSYTHPIYCYRRVCLCSQPTLFYPPGCFPLWVCKRWIWSWNHLHQVIQTLQRPEASTVSGLAHKAHHQLFSTLIFYHTFHLSFRTPWAMSNYWNSLKVLCSFSPSVVDLSAWKIYPTL